MAIKDCDLLATVAWVDDAVSALDIGTSPLSCYLIKDGFIHATNGRMIAAAPFPFDLEGEYLVSAEAFAKVLKNRPDGDFEWFTEPGLLILKRGRFKGKIKTMDIDQWVYPADKPDPEEIPADLLPALRVMLPFCSDNATKPWATCLLLHNEAVWASNNVVVARAACEGLECPTEYLLPRWAAEFICGREEGLEGWQKGDTFCSFTWENGAWMRTSLVEDTFPPVAKVLDTYYDGAFPEVAFTSDWVTAVRRVGRITGDPVVRLRADGVYGAAGGEVVMVEDDACTVCPEGRLETIWDLRFLEAVIDAATHWNPLTYPNPSPFRGPGFEGIIVGRRD